MNYIYYVFIIFMKRTLKKLFLCGMIIGFCIIPTENLQINAAKNNVPDYYYANYKFADDWDAILDRFTLAKAKYSTDNEIPTSDFENLAKYFDNVFPHLTKEYSSVYEKCKILANNLANSYSKRDMEALMWNSCNKSLMQAINTIKSLYTVIPSVNVNPAEWNAPLTVSFNATNSRDPSLETIPVDNFYRYYRDENWDDTPIWNGQTITHTFDEPGKYIVHLVVRSSNVDTKGILDWDKDIEINVYPRVADLVVYANTRRMQKGVPLKIWTTEAEKWIVFDWTLTRPRWWTEIKEYRWTISSNTETVYDSRTQKWVPTYINVPLKWNWLFKVRLKIVDNQKNELSEEYQLYLSDPVAIIKQSPEKWTTSTTFNFDGSASYSITNRLSSYLWEVFDWNWWDDNGNRIITFQGKGMDLNWNKKLKPWNYMVKLTVTDQAWNKTVDTKDLYAESTTPTPQFTITPTNKREYPSEFTLDASNTTDIDVNNKVDSLEYERQFSTDNFKILSTENNNQKIVVQFNEKWKHTIRMVAIDQYWKFASVSKTVEVKSTLRPEIEIKPWPITWWKVLDFESSVNQPVWDYSRNFGDGTEWISSSKAIETQHIYGKKWIYSVKLTVTTEDWESNTVSEKAFIWEIEKPIAAYRVINDKGFSIQSSDKCGTGTNMEEAYPIDRYETFTINPSRSVNTKWTSNLLEYVFEKEAIAWTNGSKIVNLFSDSFSQIWCHYVDLTVKDKNVWKQDKTRIWFNVKNALPTIKNVVLSFPQYSDNNNALWFTSDESSNKSIFGCSWTSNLTVRVTAVEPDDPDWNISRLRFYYYNIDDPDRILWYKESWVTIPYVYFILPRISGEYKFWVMAYDNDWWMIDSNDYLASNPSIYFSADCGDAEIPTVLLKVSSTNIQVWDTVTYTITSKSLSNNDDFETDRTFYYDFEWDWVWDLVTKRDTETHTFNEAHEDWVIPKVAVEYRWKLWQAEWNRIIVKNWIKPILLTNTYGNMAIFRDMSVWAIQQREICFETAECEAWNTKFKKTLKSIIDPENIAWANNDTIRENDSFIRNYDNYWEHNISIDLKSKYWIEVKTWFKIKTVQDTSNWKIAPWVNMITIPETTFTNGNPEVFLNKTMNNTLVIYINNESWETCYVDTDIATDSDRDKKSDNDMDIQCNKLAKIKYEPDYGSTIWRIYFTNDWKLTFKNFYVTFEWVILELDEEKKEIYDKITYLVNGIEDLSAGNTDLKKSLDKLRKNLNNRSEVTSLVISINEQIENWWIKMSSDQKETLDYVLNYLSNEDTVTATLSVWMNEYEKNKREILATLPSQWKSEIEWKFNEFDKNSEEYWLEKRAKELEWIWDMTIKYSKKNEGDESYYAIYFCKIFDYFDMSTYTDRCWSTDNTITDDYKKATVSEKSKFPLRLKIILIILVWWLLTMWWIIIFFSIKARLNSKTENDDDEE